MTYQLSKQGISHPTVQDIALLSFSGEQAKFKPNKSPKDDKDGWSRRKACKRVPECETKVVYNAKLWLRILTRALGYACLKCEDKPTYLDKSARLNLHTLTRAQGLPWVKCEAKWLPVEKSYTLYLFYILNPILMINMEN